MTTPTSGMTGSGTPESQWTHVKLFNKVKDGVSGLFGEGKIASRIGGFFGWSVAILTSPATLLGGLVYDGGQKIKSLFSRDAKIVESVEKKVPTKAEFEALQNKLSAAEAEVKKVELEKADLRNHADSQMNAMSKLDHDAQEALKNARAAHERDHSSKVRFIRKQQSEIEDLKKAHHAQAGEIDKLCDALAQNVNKNAQLSVDLMDAKQAADRNMDEARAEKRRGDVLRGEWFNELHRPWQDKYLEELLRDVDDHAETGSETGSEAGSVASSGNVVQDEPRLKHTVTAPGAEPRTVRLTQGEAEVVAERVAQGNHKIQQVQERAERLVMLQDLKRREAELQEVRRAEHGLVSGDSSSEYSSTETDTDDSDDSSVTSDDDVTIGYDCETGTVQRSRPNPAGNVPFQMDTRGVEMTTPQLLQHNLDESMSSQSAVYARTYTASRPQMATSTHTATPARGGLVDTLQLPEEDSMVNESMPRGPLTMHTSLLSERRRASFDGDISFERDVVEVTHSDLEAFKVLPPLKPTVCRHDLPRAQGHGQSTAGAPNAQDLPDVEI